MFDKTIEELVREYVQIGNAPQWNKVFCEVCGDGSRAKGPRGGWLFNDEMCFYHCFNCGVDGNFDPNREHPFSKDMKPILDAFMIPEKEYYAIAYKKRALENNPKFAKTERKKIDIPVLELPDYFYKLVEGKKDNLIVQNAYNELKRRNIDPDDYTFYLSNGRSKMGTKHESTAKSLMNRLIIPFFNPAGELIYYQARSLDPDAKKRYINADTPRTNVIYGMDRLSMTPDKPLYVTEGFFDAYHLKGVSIQENRLSTGQIELLKKSPRKKVFVPDKNSDSTKVIDEFIKQEWSISVPDIGSSCKDIDESIRKYGKLYTIQQVVSNVYDAEYAKILLKMNGYINNS